MNTKTRKYFKLPLPLWLRICVALSLTLVVVAFVATQFGLEHRKKQLESTLKEQSWQTLQLLSAGALESVISEDIEQLETLVRESTRFDDDLNSISIFNESNQRLINWTRPTFEMVQDTYTYNIDITYEGEKFGHVVATWDPARLLEKITTDIVQERNRLIISLLTLTTLSLVLLRFDVITPMNQLRKRLEKLSQGDQCDALVIKSSREMAMFADAVNDLDRTMAESRLLSTELEYQANHDLLTGLTNRYAFEKYLKNHLLERRKDHPEATLLYIDLDQFKLVNDTCGHAAGDALLIQLSSVLKQHTNDNSIFARLGGDEFALILKETPLQEGLKIAEEIRNAAQSFRFSWEGRSFTVETSIGAVPINQENQSFEELLSAADEACYSAKNEGRNRVYVYQEEDEDLRARRDQGEWIPRILDAIENSRLVLYGQPIEPTDRNSNQTMHIEILVRMLSADQELIPPGAFIPAAERYGLMPQVDRLVVTNTLLWLADQATQNDDLPICAINISGHSICDPDFKKFVLDSLNENPDLCSYISFEITETAAVANLASAVQFMEAIKVLGCSFALDDFGTGMSSFTYLKNLPVDYVKIDGAFVQNILDDATSRAMVRAIFDIAAVMEIQSIAEFVENDAVIQFCCNKTTRLTRP